MTLIDFDSFDQVPPQRLETEEARFVPGEPPLPDPSEGIVGNVKEVLVQSEVVVQVTQESEPEVTPAPAVVDVNDRATLFCGDSREVLATLPDNSIDAIVTDPPYGLSKEPDAVEVLSNWLAGNDYTHTGGGFMGKSWDSFVPGPALWKEAIRVLKPGGHILCFAGSRTVDLMGMSLRLAGFEIRDQLQWLYGSGFPKGHDIAKAIDKKAGHWRGRAGAVSGGSVAMSGPHYERTEKGDPITEEAQKWDGWDTNLKPGHEPVILARKPLSGTVADTVLEWGTGGINIGGTRVEGDRWPANVLLGHHEACEGDTCHEDCAVLMLDTQADEVSRFFYSAKASKKEREAGLEGEASGESKTKTKRVNVHPTVKPIELMRYLVRLVTPPNGLVLDPFNGSGSTGIAAILEGKRYVGIELDPSYVELSSKRILHWAEE